MTLDEKVRDDLEDYARLVSDDGDHEALCLINNLEYNPPNPKLKASYIRFYYSKKRHYREIYAKIQVFEKIDPFKQDI